ncbi:MAG: recombinase family protein [bacterium]|nr:recombinase family protein [bacterium]
MNENKADPSAGPGAPGSVVQGHHRDRLAVVYVRQSTLQQVNRHPESGRLQYGLVGRAAALGWSPQRILVIDEDQGVSGASAQGRSGFQRLVTEIGLGHVGIVLGVDMSRLARSCWAWHQLLEMCVLFRTLLGDLDGVYDPAQYNDWLVLVMKGTMSEAELHVLKQRLHEGRLAKARRGELAVRLPMGYLRQPSGEVEKDPDQQAQAVMATVFEVFERCRTIQGVLDHLVHHQVRLPCRVPWGARKGELEWRRPVRATLSTVLHHPIYAGAYVYGRRPVDARRKKPGRPGTGRTVAAQAEWEVLLKDHYPAYITWEQHERNVRHIEANRAPGGGVPRKGPSLLCGLVRCGRCGARMTTRYSNNGRGLRYVCDRARTDHGQALCQSLAGEALDRLAATLVLRALEPAALEVSVRAADDLEAERAQLHAHWRQRMERARFEAERAWRQYNAVEPENRLAARTLEGNWEQALAAQERLRMEHRRFLAEEPAPLPASEREAIQRLASDIPALWNASDTAAKEKQEIVSNLLDQVVVAVQGETEKVDAQLHWAGGHRTPASFVRPVARLDQLSYYPELLDRVKALHGEGRQSVEVAAVLNAEGWRPPKRRGTFNGSMVRALFSRQGLRSPAARGAGPSGSCRRQPHEWTIRELGHELGIPEPTLQGWLARDTHGLEARLDRGGSHPLWLIWADPSEIERLHALRTKPRAHARG